MGPIWATGIWANPYGTHAEPGCTPHMGPIWVAHMGPIWACLLGRSVLCLVSRDGLPHGATGLSAVCDCGIP